MSKGSEGIFRQPVLTPHGVNTDAEPAAACPRLGRLIGGCRFRPRYDLGIPDLSQFSSLKGAHEGFFENFRPKTYVHDICETCGQTAHRP